MQSTRKIGLIWQLDFMIDKGANAEITYGFEDMNIQVPSGTGENAEHAKWVLNGSVTISTNEKGNSPKS